MSVAGTPGPPEELGPEELGPEELPMCPLGTVLFPSALLPHQLGDPAAPATLTLDPDPAVTSWQAARAAPMGPADAQRVLEAPDTAECLALLAEVLSDQAPCLRYGWRSGRKARRPGRGRRQLRGRQRCGRRQGDRVANERSEDIPSLAREMGTMLIDYVKQETLDPLKGLTRFVALGLAGMAVMGIGLVLLVLGGLRLLQTETGDTFQGHLSFVPYACAVAVCGIVAGGALKASKKSPKDGKKRGGGR